MKFQSSKKSLESEVSEKDVKDSKRNIVVKSVVGSREWAEHAARCNLGRLDTVNVDGREWNVNDTDSNKKQGMMDLENVEAKQKESEEHSKHNPIAMKDSAYFGNSGTKKVLAGCACGKEINVAIEDRTTSYGANMKADDTDKTGKYFIPQSAQGDDSKGEYFIGDKKDAFEMKYGAGFGKIGKKEKKTSEYAREGEFYG